MPQWKLILAYDGTPFHGWQIQPGLPTVQGLLSDAIHRVTGERVLPQGSGRTDAGVALRSPIPAVNLHTALNRCLPPSVRILSAEPVPADFHARHSAIRKTYEYRIFPLKPPLQAPQDARVELHARVDQHHLVVQDHLAESEANQRSSSLDSLPATATARKSTAAALRICPPTLAPFVWPCPWPLDLDPANQAAAQVLGTHDFTSFAASDPDLTLRNSPAQAPAAPDFPASSESAGSSPQTTLLQVATAPTPIRTISHSRWHADGDLLVYRVTANGFLHHMVRNLVGTFVQCGARRLSPDAIPSILAARSRSAAGPTAPATGLFLVSVEYPPLEPGTSHHIEPGASNIGR
jgi:tRNA pseudouridine38-40 synthase